MKIRVFFLLALMLCTCTKLDVSQLIGTWELVSVNGHPIQSGVYLRWTFTETTVTVESDMDCIEVIEYEAKDGTLTVISVISQKGSQCGDEEDSAGKLGTYTIDGNSLSVTITDPDLDPPIATFLFTKTQ